MPSPTRDVVRAATGRTIAKEIDFCAGHRLIKYEGKCRNVHGHNLKLVVSFFSHSLNHQGMVVDFSKIKDTVKAWVDDNLDHGFIVNKCDKDMIAFLKTNNQKHFILNDDNLALLNTYSRDEIAARPELTNPTMENIALCIRLWLESQVSTFGTEEHVVDVESVRLYESETGWCDI